MRTTILRLVAAAPLATASPLLLVLALSACSATSPPTSGAADLAAMPSPDDAHVVLVARGMACPKCVTNADLQLMRIPGVRKVEIDMKHGFITVEVDPAQRPTREAYAAAIDAAGLTLVSVHESPTGAAP